MTARSSSRSDATPVWLPLDEGETPLWTGRPHPIAAAWIAALGGAIIVAGIAVLTVAVENDALLLGLTLGGPSVLLGVLVAIAGSLYRQGSRYAVTTAAVYRRSGPPSGAMAMIPLADVKAIDVDQSPLDRLLSIGDVEIDAGETAVTLRAVSTPRDVADRISDRADVEGEC